MVDRQSWKDWVLIRSSLFRIQTCRLTRVPIATPPSCDYTQDSPSHNNPTEMPSETTHALQFTSDPAKTGGVEKVTFIFMNQLHLCNGSDLVNVVNLKGRGRRGSEGRIKGGAGVGSEGRGEREQQGRGTRGAGGREGRERQGRGTRGAREGQEGVAREGQEGGEGGREGS